MTEVLPLSQLDSRWRSAKIGGTPYTIGGFGCTITSLCMCLHKLRGFQARPDDGGKFWVFNNNAEILWTQVKFKGAEFVWRGYSADLNKVKEYANSDDKAAIIRVLYGKKLDKVHWVYLEKVDGSIMHIIDPLGGKRYAGLPAKYKFSGYALLKAKPIT